MLQSICSSILHLNIYSVYYSEEPRGIFPIGIDFYKCKNFKLAHVQNFRFKIPADFTNVYTLERCNLTFLLPLYGERAIKMCFMFRGRMNLIPFFQAYWLCDEWRKLGLHPLFRDINRNHANLLLLFYINAENTLENDAQMCEFVYQFAAHLLHARL